MIKRFLCWLWGHKTVYKAATGEVVTVDRTFDRDMKVPLVILQRSKFCLRCGADVHKE